MMLRVTALNDAPLRPERDFVLYWMTSARRTTWSHALDQALRLCRTWNKPLLVFEPLRLDYAWATVRSHTFIVQGMVDNAAACAERGVTYLPWVEGTKGEGRGMLAALAEHACCVVTDAFPGFFLHRMTAAAGERLDVRLFRVDSNGMLPLDASDRAFPVAHAFRRHLHKTLLQHLDQPDADPLHGYDLGAAPIPAEISARWRASDLPALLAGGLRALPLDPVPPAPDVGGAIAGQRAVERFLTHRLARYADERNDPDSDAASGLSPWLHFGHVSAQQVAWAVLDRYGWSPALVSPAFVGKREGWWGLPDEAESFLDELITWREVGYGYCHHRPHDFDRYESLPDWAQETLRKHASDRREHVYTAAQLDAATTHDLLWNAAQRQLKGEGRIHNYLRMVWGKKVLEWSATPREALATLIELNNRYALDGRDPNSYSGIFWCFGRFDRAWGPERPIFGTVRYMSSDNTARKVNVKRYLARWGAQPRLL